MTVDGLKIRKATPEDAAAILKYCKDALLETKTMFWGGVAVDEFAKIVPSFTVAELHGRIVSQMRMSFPHEISYVSLAEEKVSVQDAFLHHLLTQYNQRRKGIETEILRSLEEEASQNVDIGSIYVAAERNSSKSIFEDNGYSLVGKGCMSCGFFNHKKCGIAPVYRKEIHDST